MMHSVKIMDVSFAELVYRFLFALFSIPHRMSDQENKKLEGHYSNFIRNFYPEKTTNVLIQAF